MNMVNVETLLPIAKQIDSRLQGKQRLDDKTAQNIIDGWIAELDRRIGILKKYHSGPLKHVQELIEYFQTDETEDTCHPTPSTPTSHKTSSSYLSPPQLRVRNTTPSKSTPVSQKTSSSYLSPPQLHERQTIEPGSPKLELSSYTQQLLTNNYQTDLNDLDQMNDMRISGVSTCISSISLEEYETVPSFMRTQLSFEDLNWWIEELNDVVTEKRFLNGDSTELELELNEVEQIGKQSKGVLVALLTLNRLKIKSEGVYRLV